MKLDQLENSKKNNKNDTDRLKHAILEYEELNETIKLKIQGSRKKVKNLPKGNPFDSTEYLEKQRENEIHAPFITLIEDMEYLRNGFLRMVFFINSEGEIEPNRFFRDSRVIAEFVEKIIDR